VDAVKLKLGVLISGRGSNLQALIDAAADPSFPAEIALVISNRADAGGLARAEAAGIVTKIIPHKDFASREAFDSALTETLRAAGVGLVCLAGFMRLLTAGFAKDWHDHLINIHPSLLPSFKGLNSHAQALAAGVRFSGCTVHYVRPEMDAGPIILQAAVPVHDGDDEDSLAARILTAEHRCYPLAVKLIAEDRIQVIDEIVRVIDGRFPDAPLLNPDG
jgi:phosphoribosylglycinamide formyltransferase-1